MLRLRLFTLSAMAVLCASLAAAPRVTFERTIPAPQNLGGATDLAIVFAIGDSDKITTFLDSFIDQTNRSGALRMHDATVIGRSLSNGQLDAAAAERVRRQYAADVFVRVSAFTCRTADRSAEGSTYNYEGKRVKRRHRFVDAVCEAKVDLIKGATLTRLTTYRVVGEGTSPRVDRLTGEEGTVALEQAARYAGVSAAEQITPRRLRETIVLEQNAPRFTEGMVMIESGRPKEAKKIWEAAAQRDPSSATLHFNLAAVSEAAGDVEAAAKHHAQVAKLAPGDRRYRTEFDMFRKRNGIK